MEIFHSSRGGRADYAPYDLNYSVSIKKQFRAPRYQLDLKTKNATFRIFVVGFRTAIES